MKITVNSQSYKIDRVTTLLEALYQIKSTQDSDLTFDAGCRSGVCGCCSVRVNGKEQLACSYEPKDGDVIEPIKYYPKKKGLLVDKSSGYRLITKDKSALKEYKDEVLDTTDEKLTQVQTDCILCSSCYSACPVLEVNSNFLGPFALTRAYRYVADKRVGNAKEIVDSVQNSGIWDCTLCGECTVVCPMGIDPKSDIIQLRNQSAKYGYTDPNFANMGFGGGFGFDPNGGF